MLPKKLCNSWIQISSLPVPFPLLQKLHAKSKLNVFREPAPHLQQDWKRAALCSKQVLHAFRALVSGESMAMGTLLRAPRNRLCQRGALFGRWQTYCAAIFPVVMPRSVRTTNAFNFQIFQ